MPSTTTVVFGVSSRVGFVHPKRNDHSGQSSEGSDRVNGGGDGDHVSEDAGKECADREAAIAPEPVDAD